MEGSEIETTWILLNQLEYQVKNSGTKLEIEEWVVW